MSNCVLTKSFAPPPFSISNVLRYCGCPANDKEINEKINNCIETVINKLTYNVCYTVLDLEINGSVCDFKLFSENSNDLSQCLKGCKKAIIFGATIGVEIDRIISKYSRISPSSAVIYQAIGAERIEALCNEFCSYIKSTYGNTTPRFSAGYGDLNLSAQNEIFKVLNCSKNIGLTLNNSMLMSPSKSVTAFVGIL